MKKLSMTEHEYEEVITFLKQYEKLKDAFEHLTKNQIKRVT